MAQVFGQIDSLKQIRTVLSKKGITRFNSISDIQDFFDSYELEKREVVDKAGGDVDRELDALQALGHSYQKRLDTKKIKISQGLHSKIQILESKGGLIKGTNKSNRLFQLLDLLHLSFLTAKKYILDKNFDRIVFLGTYFIKRKLNSIVKKIKDYSINRQRIIDDRCSPALSKLVYIKEVLEALQPLIAGAKGEHLVVKEIEKLSDEHILINDFSMTFNPPIYNRKEKDRIFSIQIDHLLVTKAGIFVLETKNWSERSLERLDIWSPVKQVQRSAYALFILLNSKSNRSKNGLNWHPWGTKQIPIRNVVVMINEKPREKFNFVAVKSLNELNGYINYFNPVFSDEEFNRVVNRLRMLNR
jgi:hypothetical protein